MKMTAYEATTTIKAGGELSLQDVPFDTGMQVEVLVLPKKRLSADEFRSAWDRLCLEFRNQRLGQEITDEVIQLEIDSHRAAR